jgi:hypothetical protein
MEPRHAISHCLVAEDYGFFAAVKLGVHRGAAGPIRRRSGDIEIK